jgi:UDP-N-acetylglucosamine 2-epimerase (non-hydrolysing)
LIAFIVGTTAELIKVAPVYHELRSRGHAAEFWYTAQHVEELESTLADLRLPPIARWLVPEHAAVNLARPAQVPGWAFRLLRTFVRDRAALRRRLGSDGEPPVVLVHGDTFTAPIGAVMGRVLGARIGHLEAGMRSGSLRNPFPEELNRRAAAHLVDVHFAPTSVEARNLQHRRGAVVTMGANTVVDSIRLALDHPVDPGVRLPEKFGIATLHRFELVRQEDAFRASLETLRDYARREVPIVYFAGASERERINAFGLWDLFDPERFRLEEKLSYVRFQPVLAEAEFVVTDSGGVQEESYLLGIPCAVHRTHTERHVGEGEQMVLTRYDLAALRGFLADHERYRVPSILERYRSSEVVVDALEAMSGTRTVTR